MPIVIETIGEFDQRHGANSVLVDRSHWIYSDGAQVMRDWYGERRKEPPTDEWELLKVQRRYWQAKVDEQAERFNTTQSKLAEQALFSAMCPTVWRPPPENATEILHKAKSRVQEVKKQLRKIEEQIRESPEEIAKRDARKQEAERQQTLGQRLREIDSITLDD